jgi:hypothetical protein
MSTPPAFADAAQTWNRRYNSAEFLFGTAPNEWLRGQAHVLAAFADLSISELREYEAGIHEGQDHSGRSALVGLVARR